MTHGQRLAWSCLATALVAACPSAARASFHDMQIEQVIGGVHGDTTVQAIQLRMSSAGQNFVSGAQVVVRDAAGNNPITVHNMTTNVLSGADRRILIATANLPSFTNPPLTPDFTITNPIPASYMAAGTLTFESDTGIVYWRLSWGGANYTGSGSVNIFNDADQNANPPFPAPLPKCTTQALQFRFAFNANSTNNANDYLFTPGPAQLTRNNGMTGMVTGPAPPTGACCVSVNNCQVHSACVCGDLGGAYQGDGTPCLPTLCLPDCNNNGIPDLEERDCDRNGQPDECDITGNPSLDFNHNDILDVCEPEVSTNIRNGDWDGDCDVDLVDYGSFQIAAGRHFDELAPCYPDGSSLADMNIDDILSVLDAFAFDSAMQGPIQPLPSCEPDAGCGDAWSVAPYDNNLPFGGSYFQFGTDYPPIPADFFGPGSQPFSGIIILEGQAFDGLNLGSTDTIIERPPLRFGFGDLPLCDIVPMRLKSLSLRSADPIIVPHVNGPSDCNGNGVPDVTDIAIGNSVDQNANGVPDECEWYVEVVPSIIEPPEGVLGGCKTHANGGTFSATFYVQPLFVFVNKAELDTGLPPDSDNVKILDTGVEPPVLPPIQFNFFDTPFSICPPDLGIYVTPCSEGNFVPGVDTSPPFRGPGTTACAVLTSPSFHLKLCPPTCVDPGCTLSAVGPPLGQCFPPGCDSPACAPFPPQMLTGEACSGFDPSGCSTTGHFLVRPGTCPMLGPCLFGGGVCVQFYGPPASCTPVGGGVVCP